MPHRFQIGLYPLFSRLHCPNNTTLLHYSIPASYAGYSTQVICGASTVITDYVGISNLDSDRHEKITIQMWHITLLAEPFIRLLHWLSKHQQQSLTALFRTYSTNHVCSSRRPYLTSYDMTPGFKSFTIKINSDLRFIRP